jgi:acetyl esterase/lipase
MHVTDAQIDLQLRFAGRVFRRYLHTYDEAKFRRIQKSLRRFLQGQKVRGLRNREECIPRASDGTSLRLRIYAPRVRKVDAPGVLWLHGGGYAIGLPEMCGRMVRRLVDASGCMVVVPDYRLSIEAPYPAALDDAYEALVWLKRNARRLGVRDDQIIVGGESAGGGLTAALSLYARDRGEVRIAFQMPLYPMLDDRMNGASATDNDAPVWNSNANRAAWNLYLGGLDRTDVPVYAAPARATDLRGLPPTASFVGALEPFLDETVQYVADLRAAGVPVDFEVYPGCYHAFVTANPNADVSRRAIEAVLASFRHAVANRFAAQDDRA